jgi:hypothetical protein
MFPLLSSVLAVRSVARGVGHSRKMTRIWRPALHVIWYVFLAFVMPRAIYSELPSQYDPKYYTESDRRSEHLCKSHTKEPVAEANEVMPLHPLAPPKKPPDWTSLGKFSGDLLIEAIVDSSGTPQCAAVIRTNLPKPVVERLLAAFLEQRFSKPMNKQGKNVPCYYYTVLSAGGGLQCQ